MRYRWVHVTDESQHQWVFKRNCALTPRQLAWWFVSLSVVSLLVATAFATHGVWMVFPFTCLEVTALGIAFVAYARHAADYERIVFAPRRLLVERSMGKSIDRYECEPTWVRVEYAGSVRSPVRLVVGKEQLEVGRFVPSAQRKDFVRELRASLARWPAS
jgi:uncharacterized membrane protein